LRVSRSSSKAEYHALTGDTCELQWLLYLLKDLKVTTNKLSLLHCDNQSAIRIAANSVFHERTKHLEIDISFFSAQLSTKNIFQNAYNGE